MAVVEQQQRESPAQFEPTRWSVIYQWRSGDAAQQQAAMDSLCTAYWYPVYAFLRRSGRSVEDAEDLTQEFFSRLLNGRLLAAVDPARGRFRSLLLAAVKNLNVDAARSEQSFRRGGRAQMVLIDAGLAEERWQADAPRADLRTSPSTGRGRPQCWTGPARCCGRSMSAAAAWHFSPNSSPG